LPFAWFSLVARRLQVEGMPPKRHEESGSASFADAGLVGRVQVNITAKN
jgi:hypothetical protein